jgi:lipoyl(octanoyl) transferase
MTELHEYPVSSYKKVWDEQKELLDQIVNGKKQGVEQPHHLILCEHNPVYTMGKSADSNNLLASEELLKTRGAEVFNIERGGDITFHGPGQWVAYPIFDLEKLEIGLRIYIEKLEEVLIATLSDFGIEGRRIEGLTGVWVDSVLGDERKIAAIGVMSRRFVTMHGFALNVNTDLSYFDLMVPCGIQDKGVTSISQELNKEMSMDEVKKSIKKHFKNIFHLNFA